jgi:cellulose synthase/poly-beta-1,6-N-acetylglucosamine synthase-like glycosyltransferase
VAHSLLLILLSVACAGILYTYLGFPAVAALLTAMRRSQSINPEANGASPRVSVIVSAHNEGECIEARIRNVLESAYPRDMLDVMVVSDASTDRTDDAVRSFAAEGVRLVVQQQRRGKSAGLNRAMALARGDIVVLTDANAMYPPRTIASLVRCFGDPAVGLATGYTSYVRTASGPIAHAINLYTSLELVIKRAESQWGSCVGADGAVFAIRRSLYRELRDDDINDVVVPLRVVEQGYRCILAEDAFCFEQPGKNLESEFRRQSRITNRTLHALWRNRRLLNPFRFGLFSFFLFSHKVIRFIVPLLLALAAGSLALLTGTGAVGLLVAIGTIAMLGMAAGERTRMARTPPWASLSRLLNLLGIFLAMNMAILQGWWFFLSGRRHVVWQHDR